MKALVLGGSVFVGRRLVEMLAAQGHEVVVLNRGRTPTTIPDGVRLVKADRTDTDSMRAALVGTSWDAVFDVSGFVMAAGGSDIEALIDIVDGRVGHYVYVSSIMAYDQSLVGVVPWTEDLPSDSAGVRTYGGFKATAERAMLARFERTGFPVTISRPAAIYGPHNNIYDMETPMFLRLQRGLPILVPHEGLVTGSYGHVDDLCATLIAFVGNRDAQGQIINSTAEAVTTLHYVETLARIVGRDPHIVFVPSEVPDGFPRGVYGHLFSKAHHAVLSTEKLHRIVGPVARVDFATGHRMTYEWFLAQGWSDLSQPLVDPVWFASWDFAAEARAAAMLGATS
ncbi:MAG: NAD-dependent epimerase/dehydratase family protein [Ilumatobacteraceae bacterium]